MKFVEWFKKKQICVTLLLWEFLRSLLTYRPGQADVILLKLSGIDPSRLQSISWVWVELDENCGLDLKRRTYLHCTPLYFFFTYRKKDPISFNGRKVAYISKPFIQIWWKRHGSVMAQTVLLSKLFQFLFSEIIRKKHCTFFLYGSLMGLNFDQFWFLPVPYTYTHGH